MSRLRGWGALVACVAVLSAGCAHRSQTPILTPAPGAPGVASPNSSARSATNIAFSDTTQAAGLHYTWQIPGRRPLNILQTIGNGCAFLDFDNDGNLDILLVGARVALYKGDGHGHFTDVTHETGLDAISGHFLGCAVGDYDNDGYDDLYITAYRGGVLLHNEPTNDQRPTTNNSSVRRPSSFVVRRFRDVTNEAGIPPQPWGTSCTFADFDGDGRLDLYICNYVAFGPQTKPQLCAYSGLMSACGPRFYAAEHGVLYHNEGSGRFRDVTQACRMQAVAGKGLGVAAADFDGSGRAGLAIANDEMAGDLLANAGRRMSNIGVKSGTAYDSAGNVHGGMGADWGDYDNDGRLDLAVATFQHEAKCLYHNDGKGIFTESSANVGLAEKTVPNVAFGIKFLDVDNDGYLDLAIANGHVQDNISAIDKTTTYRQRMQVLHSIHGTRFEDVSALAGSVFDRTIVGRGLAIGDYDNDGRMDVLVVDSEGSPILLHNDSKPVGNWLVLNLVGTRSNRDGFGALVTADAGGRKLLRLCHADGSYMSSSDRRVHVGLADSTSATVTVKWPSGHTDRFASLKANQQWRLVEGHPKPE